MPSFPISQSGFCQAPREVASKARTMLPSPLQQQAGSTSYVIIGPIYSIDPANNSQHHTIDYQTTITVDCPPTCPSTTCPLTTRPPTRRVQPQRPLSSASLRSSASLSHTPPTSPLLLPLPPFRPRPRQSQRPPASRPTSRAGACSRSPATSSPNARSRGICCCAGGKKASVEASFVDSEKCPGCDHSGCNKCVRYQRVQAAVLGLCGEGKEGACE
jgi:hypothetical protein